MDGIHILPQIEIYIGSDLFYTIRVFGWLLPETHDLYETNKRSVKWITISQLLKEVLNYQLCQGIKDPLVQSLQHQKLHIISKIFLLPVNSEDMMDIR